MTGASENPAHVRLARLAVTVAVLLTFWPVLTCSLDGWDDGMNITGNPSFNPPAMRNLKRYWTGPAFDIYAPLTFTAWGAIAPIAYHDDAPPDARWSAWPFHAASLAVHAAAALVAFELLRRLSGSLAGGFIGAMVFALHPLAVELVAWASGLKDALAGMLGLLALLLYVQGSRGRYVAATIVFVFAMLAKPSAVVLPAVALLLDATFGKNTIRAAIVRSIPWFALAVPFVLIAHHAQPAEALSREVPLAVRPLVALDSLGFYLVKLLWPLRLASDYGRTPHAVVARGWGGSMLWMLPLVASAVVFLVPRIRRTIAAPVALGIFFITLLPMLGLLPFDFQIYSTVADHYAYPALLAPALAAAWVVTRCGRQRSIVLGGVVCLLLAALSFGQTWTWRNTRSISEQTLRANPESWGAHSNLARLHLAEGRSDEALHHALAAVRANPAWPDNHTGLGQVYSQRREFAKAQESFRKALEIDANDVPARAGLGDALADAGDRAAAIGMYKELLRRSPRSVIAISNLAGLYAETQDFDEAIRLYDQAISIDPAFGPAHIGRQRAADERLKRSLPGQ